MHGIFAWRSSQQRVGSQINEEIALACKRNHASGPAMRRPTFAMTRSASSGPRPEVHRGCGTYKKHSYVFFLPVPVLVRARGLAEGSCYFDEVTDESW